jgi:hypothetical protein
VDAAEDVATLELVGEDAAGVGRERFFLNKGAAGEVEDEATAELDSWDAIVQQLRCVVWVTRSRNVEAEIEPLLLLSCFRLAAPLSLSASAATPGPLLVASTPFVAPCFLSFSHRLLWAMAHGSARDKGKSRAIQPHPQPEASVASLTTLALSSRAQPHPHPHPPPPSRPQPPHMTMPLSPPKTSPSPPGLPPFPGEEPNDVFSQAGPSRQPIQHAPAMRGPPIDVDAVEPSSTPVEVDLVVQCKACRTIVGDSSAYVAARKDLGLLVLSSESALWGKASTATAYSRLTSALLSPNLVTGVAQHVVLSNPPSTSQDPDLNSLYMPLDITCGSCGSPLGKVYRMTAAGLDELRDGYSFERDRIAV